MTIINIKNIRLMKKLLLRSFTLMALCLMANGPAWADSVAKIGETEYATLQAAFDAVPSNGTETTTITLLSSAATDGVISGDGVILYSTDVKNVTLDLNNLTYNVSGSLVGSSGTVTQGFHFENGNTVTIKNGTLKATNTSARILIQNYCNLTLDGVTVDGTDHTYSSVVSINFGTLTTTGSTNIKAKSGNQAINIYYGMSSDYYDGITVNLGDGTSISGVIYYTKSPKVTSTDWTEKTKVTIDSKTNLDNAGFYYSTSTSETPNITIGEKNVTNLDYVARVGSYKYTTIDGAFANGTNSTVYILKTGTYTLPDLSDRKMTIDGSEATDGDVEFDCTETTEIKIYNSTFYKVKFRIGSNGLKINSVVENKFGYSSKPCTFDGMVIVTGAKTTFQYCTFNNSTSEAIRLYNDNDGSKPTVTVNNCTFNATEESTMPAVMVYATDNSGNNLSYTLNINSANTVSENYKATDGIKTKSSDNLWGVNATTSETTKIYKNSEQVFPSLGDIAEISSTKYQTFADALSAVTDNQTITILSDFTNDVYKSLGSSSSAKTYTLDLNGHALKFKQLSIYDNVTITDSSTGGNGSITSTLTSARTVWVYGTVNITGGNLISTDDNTSSSDNYACCTPLVIAKGGSCTISGGKVSTAKAQYGAVQLQNGGTLTVEDGAEISNTGTNSYYAAGESGNSGINAASGSTLTISGGTMSSLGTAVYTPMYNTNAVKISGGTLTGDKALYAGSYTINITGGTFNGTSYAVYAYRPNYAEMSQNISISGGNFSVTGTDGKVIYNNSPASYGTVNIPVTGGCFSDTTAVTQYLTDGYGWYASTETGYPYMVDEATAVITTDNGRTYYKTLDEAITAAEDGQTVTLLKNLASSVTISGKQITLDLGGKTLTSAGETIDGGIPTIFVNNGANVTLQNGTVAADGSSYRDVIVKNGSTLTVNKDVTMTATGGDYNYCVSVRHGDTDNNTVVINGGTFTSNNYVLAYVGAGNSFTVNDGNFNGSAGLYGSGTKGYSNNTVTVNGGTFEVSNSGFYFPNNDTVNITKCSITVTGEGQGIVARAGKVTLGDGVTITTNGTNQTTIGDNSNQLSSSAVVFDALANYPGLQENASSVINITGGTYKSNSSVNAVAVETSSTNTGKYMAVSGGSFSSQLTSDVCATGYEPVTTANSDGLYSVQEDENAASTYIYYTTEANGSKTFLDGDDITLNDGDYYSFSVPSDITGKNITYKRNFEYAVWSCWFMPFDIDASSNENVTFYQLYATLLDDDGEWYISAKPVESGTIRANVPYLIKPKTTGDQTFSVTGTTVYSTTSTVRPQKTAKVSSVSQDYTFTGIYTKKTPTDKDLGWYALSADKGGFSKRTQVSDDLALKPFRFFLTITDRDDDVYGSNSNGAKPNHTIKIIESGSSTTTGIEETLNSEDRLKDKVIYDLQGRRVTKPVKGLYIVNGKKVIIK